jgi:hypothetical protein
VVDFKEVLCQKRRSIGYIRAPDADNPGCPEYDRMFYTTPPVFVLCYLVMAEDVRQADPPSKKCRRVSQHFHHLKIASESEQVNVSHLRNQKLSDAYRRTCRHVRCRW